MRGITQISSAMFWSGARSVFCSVVLWHSIIGCSNVAEHALFTVLLCNIVFLEEEFWEGKTEGICEDKV